MRKMNISLRSLLVLALALCMVLAFAGCGGDDTGSTTESTTGSVPGNGIQSNHVHCVCVGLSKNVGEHTGCAETDGWVEIADAATLISSINALETAENKVGYYVITADMTLEEELMVPKGVTVNLCLNGKTLKGSARNIGTLNITDCAHTNGTFTGTLTGATDATILTYAGSTLNIFGGNFSSFRENGKSRVVRVDGAEYGEMKIWAGTCTFNLYQGKLYRDAESYLPGANVFVGDNGIFNMYNGLITGANVKADPVTTSTNYGGNVSVYGNSSVFNMYNGTISNGSLTGTKKCLGGNLHAFRGKVTLLGGTITGGKTDYYGGNIAITNTSPFLKASNVTISNGKVDGRFGGNIYLNGSKLTVELKNCTIIDGSCTDIGGNVYLNTGVLTIDSCTITGAKNVNGGAVSGKGTTTMTLTGNCVFGNNEKCDLLIRSSDGKFTTLSVAALTSTGVTVGTEATCVFTTDVCADGVLVPITGCTIATADGKMTITKG